MKKIQITDITLKQLAKDRQVTLLFKDKTAIAACADSIGIDTIELAGIKNVREDTIIYKTIAQNTHNAAIAIPVGTQKEDIEAAFECIKNAKRPRLQVELPVSTVQMEYVHHLKADKMTAKIAQLVTEAKKYCDDVEFVALDATRADIDFLITAIKEAEASGATCVTLCDDAGIMLPHEFTEFIKAVKAEASVPVYIQVSNSISLAVSCGVSAVMAGADGLKCTMTSGENLSTADIARVIKARGADIGIETELKDTKLYTSIDTLLNNINHNTYIAESSDDSKAILLDTESTLVQVSQACGLLGYDLSDEDCGKVYKAVMQVLEKKDSIGTKELEALIASFAMQAPSSYHLESYNTSCSNVSQSMSRVTLRYNDEILTGVAVGDGPVDSAFRAIEQIVGYQYELDDLQVQAVTEGKEALGSALVRLRNNGKLYSGNGISTDIVAASIRAYINALNKIVFEEE